MCIRDRPHIEGQMGIAWILLRHIHENVLAISKIHTVVDKIEFYTMSVS